MDSTSSTPTFLDVNKVEVTPLPPPLHGLRQDGEFWIEDGNVILVARDIAFRVYRGLLAEQSTVLADVTTATSEDFYDVFDGCPIVRLSDSPQDLVYLLRILLPKSKRRVHAKDEDEHTCEELSALARLSHKYCIHDVEEQALELLRERYTDDFDKWRFGFGKFAARRPSNECISVVNVARLTDTPSLLPTALYACCLLGTSALLDGLEREDGRVEHLSTDDLKRCLAARERLCKERADIMCETLETRVSAGCSNAVECRAALQDMVLSMATRGTLSRVIDCAALTSLVDAVHTKAFFYDVCAECKEELQLRDAKARRELWNRLPEVLGISVPGWGDSAAQDPDVSRD